MICIIDYHWNKSFILKNFLNLVNELPSFGIFHQIWWRKITSKYISDPNKLIRFFNNVFTQLY